MKPGFSVAKLAVLADPRIPEKQITIKASLDRFLQELERVGIEAETFINVAPSQIVPKLGTDMFVVMGGDGAMIHFAGHLGHLGIPFYGLNYGNVGFMMNSPRYGSRHHAENLKNGTFKAHAFPVLKVKATDLQGRVHEGIGLNDIYLQRMTPQSCKANITIGNTPLTINPILCDGIIVATPLGSTAYSYNLTGSLVAIETPALTLTPIAAHRSCPLSCMVLPMDIQIQFDILEPQKRRVQVVSDGQSHGDLTHASIGLSDDRIMLCFDHRDSENLTMRFINKACGPG